VVASIFDLESCSRILRQRYFNPTPYVSEIFTRRAANAPIAKIDGSVQVCVVFDAASDITVDFVCR